MKFLLRFRRALSAVTAVSLLASACAGPALANPVGGSVVAGGATIDQTNAALTHITQSTQRAIINWQSFSNAAGETIRFTQPGTSAIALNRVVGADPSVLAGNLQANGQVFLINPAGVVFTSTARVNVGGLLATTLNMKDQDFLDGKFQFKQEPGHSLAAVINQGKIEAASSGQVVLLAPVVNNEGEIVAAFGKVHLGAGTQAVYDPTGKGLVSVALGSEVPGDVELARTSASDLLKKAVQSSGVVKAGSVETRADGTVVLKRAAGLAMNEGTIAVGGGAVRVEGAQAAVVGPQARISANGGGDVRVLSAGAAVLARGAQIEARGGDAGGDGGFVEVSGKQRVVVEGTVDTRAPGGAGGQFLIDPRTITIVAGCAGSGDGQLPDYNFTDDAGADSTISVGALQAQTSDITLQADEGITVQASFITQGSLTMEVGSGNITMAENLSIQSGNNITLRVGTSCGGAGAMTLGSLVTPTNVVGGGRITLEGAVTGGDISVVDLFARDVTIRNGNQANPRTTASNVLFEQIDAFNTVSIETDQQIVPRLANGNTCPCLVFVRGSGGISITAGSGQVGGALQTLTCCTLSLNAYRDGFFDVRTTAARLDADVARANPSTALTVVAGGDLAVIRANASTVQLSAPSGSIRGCGAGTHVTASLAILDGANGVGLFPGIVACSFPVRTAVTNLTARATSGPVNIVQPTGALNLTEVIANGATSDVSVIANVGNLTVGQVTAGRDVQLISGQSLLAGTTLNRHVTAPGNAILRGNGGAVGARNAPLKTALSTFQTLNSCTGTFVENSIDAELQGARANNGEIRFTSCGAITVGTIAADRVTFQAATAILDGNGAAANITTDQDVENRLLAGSVIGSTADGLDVAITGSLLSSAAGSVGGTSIHISGTVSPSNELQVIQQTPGAVIFDNPGGTVRFLSAAPPPPAPAPPAAVPANAAVAFLTLNAILFGITAFQTKENPTQTNSAPVAGKDAPNDGPRPLTAPVEPLVRLSKATAGVQRVATPSQRRNERIDGALASIKEGDRAAFRTSLRKVLDLVGQEPDPAQDSILGFAAALRAFGGEPQVFSNTLLASGNVAVGALLAVRGEGLMAVVDRGGAVVEVPPGGMVFLGAGGDIVVQSADGSKQTVAGGSLVAGPSTEIVAAARANRKPRTLTPIEQTFGEFVVTVPASSPQHEVAARAIASVDGQTRTMAIKERRAVLELVGEAAVANPPQPLAFLARERAVTSYQPGDTIARGPGVSVVGVDGQVVALEPGFEVVRGSGSTLYVRNPQGKPVAAIEDGTVVARGGTPFLAASPPRPASSPEPSLSLPLAPLMLPGNVASLPGANVIGQNGANVVGQNGANVVGQNGASVVGQNGASVVGQNGASVVGQNGASVVGQNGASVIGQNGAKVVGQNGAGVVGQNGAGVIGQNGAGVVGQNGASAVRR